LFVAESEGQVPRGGGGGGAQSDPRPVPAGVDAGATGEDLSYVLSCHIDNAKLLIITKIGVFYIILT